LPDDLPANAPHLSALIRHRIGTLELDLQFELTRPWTVLFGASGSGKSTILRAIAGLLTPALGRIALGSTTVLDTEAGVNVPPHLRGTPVAPQSPSLFPHLTVRQNLEYSGVYDPPLSAVFGIDALLGKMPAQLSGGEAQRVNLARAVAARPRLLLLDEPFTGLDLALRSGLIEHLHGWQQQTRVPILSVTHDVAEVFQLGAEVIQLREGRVAAQGPVAEVLATDRERLLAELEDSRGTPWG
jgi:molybdate transport system ATP-binding protein